MKMNMVEFIDSAVPKLCVASGDFNCSGTVTSADSIGPVNYTFKSGVPPCDICPLIWSGSWN